MYIHLNKKLQQMYTAGLITIWALLFFKVFLKKYFRKLYMLLLYLYPIFYSEYCLTFKYWNSNPLPLETLTHCNFSERVFCFLRLFLAKFVSELWVTGLYSCLLCYDVVPEEISLHFTSDCVKLTTADDPVWRSRYQRSSEEDSFPRALEITYLSELKSKHGKW